MLDAQTVPREGTSAEVRCARAGALPARFSLGRFLPSLLPALDLAFAPDHGTAGAEPLREIVARLEAGPLGGGLAPAAAPDGPAPSAVAQAA